LLDDVWVGDVDGSPVVLPDGDGAPEVVVLEVGLGVVVDFVGVLLGLGERLVRVGCGVLVCTGVTVWVVVAGGGGRTSR
jgi:hypothetical protein